MFIAARNYFGQHMVSFVDDKEAFEKSFKKMGASFQERGTIIMNAYNARVHMVRPIVELFENNVAKHLGARTDCEKLTAGLDKVQIALFYFMNSLLYCLFYQLFCRRILDSSSHL